MDSLSFGYEEHFDTFESFMSTSEDESRSMEGVLNESSANYWEWEKEEMINGDVAVIPTSSYVADNYIETNSPPVKEDSQKIINDWQQMLNLETEDIKDFEMDLVSSESLNDHLDPFNITGQTTSSFDLYEFIQNKDVKPKALQRGGKKIDLKAQCYVVDVKDEHNSDDSIDMDSNENADVEETNIDVVTVPGPKVTPILQAQDVGSLLEIFEAKIDQVNQNNKHVDIKEQEESTAANINYIADRIEENVERSESTTDIDTASTTIEGKEILQNTKFIEVKSITVKLPPLPPPPPIDMKQEDTKPEIIKSKFHTDIPNENKQIIDKLPAELINRIKASSKRRSVEVIDFIPNMKRVKTQKPSKNSTHQKPSPVLPSPMESPPVTSDWVRLDHDYCVSLSPYTKYPKKDSGFESAEEDEQRQVLKNQLTVKGLDGKLMISLLKVNTIKRSVDSVAEAQKKRKLNLEEYKKRREGILKSYESSQNNSPMSSGCCSPAVEDENARRLKHQEKLLRMAAELLKSSPKSKQAEGSVLEAVSSVHSEKYVRSSDANKIEKRKNMTLERGKENSKRPKSCYEKCAMVTTIEQREASSKTENEWVDIAEQIKVPSDFITKTLVSIGVNTDELKIPIRKSKQMGIVPPIKQLEEIKPILQNASTKISSNSLIASVIENVQNKVKKAIPVVNNQDIVETEPIHGEDKTIIYLPKVRERVKTKDVATQCEFIKDCIDLTTSTEKDSKLSRNSYKVERHRSRECSRGQSSRSSSNDSRYSNSSRSSGSRSISPQRIPSRKRSNHISKDHLRAVEERRIVYVGGISSRTTKEDLRRRFQKFGSITKITIHFRDYGDNYGFVTFMYNVDAYEAVEHGNDDPTLPQYDLSFGGRRIFCRTGYSDLDNIREEIGYAPIRKSEDTFDSLLREMQAKLCKRKTST